MINYANNTDCVGIEMSGITNARIEADESQGVFGFWSTACPFYAATVLSLNIYIYDTKMIQRLIRFGSSNKKTLKLVSSSNLQCSWNSYKSHWVLWRWWPIVKRKLTLASWPPWWVGHGSTWEEKPTAI